MIPYCNFFFLFPNMYSLFGKMFKNVFGKFILENKFRASKSMIINFFLTLDKAKFNEIPFVAYLNLFHFR